MAEAKYVQGYWRSPPEKARPQWIIIYDGKDRPTVVSRIRPLTWSGDLRNARPFLKRDAKRLMQEVFGDGWEDFIYLVRL